MPEETFCRLLDRALEFLFKVLRVLIAVMLFFTTIAMIYSSLTKKHGEQASLPSPLKTIAYFAVLAKSQIQQGHKKSQSAVWKILSCLFAISAIS